MLVIRSWGIPSEGKPLGPPGRLPTNSPGIEDEKLFEEQVEGFGVGMGVFITKSRMWFQKRFGGAPECPSLLTASLGCSCPWPTSWHPPHLQACVFLKVLEMHFLKMLDNSAFSY
jgi:hypothetical protein